MNPTEQPPEDKATVRAKCLRHARDHWNAPITEYGEAYFTLLIAEYRTLAVAGQPAPAAPVAGATCCQPNPCERRKAAAEVIEKLIAPGGDVIRWRDLLLLEAMLAKMQTKEAISF